MCIHINVWSQRFIKLKKNFLLSYSRKRTYNRSSVKLAYKRISETVLTFKQSLMFEKRQTVNRFNMFCFQDCIFHFFCACFCLAHPVFVLVLISVSAREASFFFSFASIVGPFLSLLERGWLLLWLLKLSAEFSLCSVWLSLINDSFLSQTSTVTPVGGH